MSSIENSRRGFLRGLASLPLIGGGVTLIGNPTAAAVPASRDLLNSYDAWLFYERRLLRYERHGRGRSDTEWDPDWLFVHRSMIKPGAECGDLVRTLNAGGRYDHQEALPSTRAAVVLSAVGCDWQEGSL